MHAPIHEPPNGMRAKTKIKPASAVSPSAGVPGPFRLSLRLTRVAGPYPRRADFVERLFLDRETGGT